MVTVIGDDLLTDLNNGKIINLEIGGLGFSLASEKWAKKQEEYMETYLEHSKRRVKKNG